MNTKTNLPEWNPYDIGTEQALLGALLVNNDAFTRVSDLLIPGDFYEGVHQTLFEVISGLIEHGKLASPLTVGAFVANYELIDGVTVKQYLARLAANACTIINAPDFAKVVRELSDRRRIMDIAIGMAPSEATQAHQLASDAIEALDVIVASGSSALPAVDMGTAMSRAVDGIAKAYQNETKIIGIPTGLKDIDSKMGGLSPGDLIVLAGRPGMGKLQPLHSPILTPSGWSSMGEMKIGTRVISQDGTVVPVVAVHPHGEQDIYRVNFSDGRSTLVGLEHLWEVSSKHWQKPRIIDTKEIMRLLSRVRYKKWLHVPLFSGDGLNDGVLPVPPYTMGAWLGDGSVSKGMITKDDDYLFDRIRAEGYQVGPPNRSRAIYGLIGDLRKAGVANCHSWEKNIPPAYFTASKVQRTELMNGLLDTDGTVEPSGTLRYCTASKQLAIDVQRLARSLGAVCKISERITKHRLAYVLSIRHRDARQLITMPRKAARLPLRYQYDKLGLRIVSVDRVGREKCQCITIDHPSGLYITDDYIVTHNSAVLSCLLLHAARKGYRCMANSLEMSAEQLAERMISDTIFDFPGENVPYSALRTGNFHEKLFESIRDAALMNRALPIEIEEQPGLTMAQIATRARRLKRRGGLDLLAIDHLDLVRPSGRYAGNKVYELGEITAACKALAKELKIPVILLCQLSRAVEQREDKRPMLADLRSSGSIEQDADAVIFLYRASYYLENNQPKEGTPEILKWSEEVQEAKNKLVAIIAKQRMGPTGPVELFCDIANNAVRNLGA